VLWLHYSYFAVGGQYLERHWVLPNYLELGLSHLVNTNRTGFPMRVVELCLRTMIGLAGSRRIPFEMHGRTCSSDTHSSTSFWDMRS
jgi:hypothetical protein